MAVKLFHMEQLSTIQVNAPKTVCVKPMTAQFILTAPFRDQNLLLEVKSGLVEQLAHVCN